MKSSQFDESSLTYRGPTKSTSRFRFDLRDTNEIFVEFLCRSDGGGGGEGGGDDGRNKWIPCGLLKNYNQKSGGKQRRWRINLVVVWRSL